MTSGNETPASTWATPLTLLIVWHSRTGTARALAHAARDGAVAALRDEPQAPPQTSCRPVNGTRSRAATDEGPSLAPNPAEESPTPTVRIECVHAGRAGAQQVCAASAYLFVAPENLASLSGVMKEFFDRTYYDVLDRVAGRPYAIIVAAGSDGQGAVRQIERIATGWRLRPVAPALVVLTGAQTAAAIAAPKRVAAAEQARAGELGAALATGLALGVF